MFDRFSVYQVDTDVNQELWRDLICFGSDCYDMSMFDKFNLVATVDASNLDQVFMLMNAWNDFDAVHILQDQRVHSLSIGDIVFDRETATYYMVDRLGFTEIQTLPQLEIA